MHRFLFLLVALCCSSLTLASAQDESVLEKYTFGTGQNSDGVAVALADKSFGGGTARAGLTFIDRTLQDNPAGTSGSLAMSVVRTVRRGEVVFALLCFGVKVRGFDATGAKVFARDLPGFTFGDSKGGRYTQAVNGIPVTVARLEVTFLGNYE